MTDPKKIPLQIEWLNLQALIQALLPGLKEAVEANKRNRPSMDDDKPDSR